MDFIKIAASDEYEVYYDKTRGMYQVCVNMFGCRVDIWFDAYGEKEIK